MGALKRVGVFLFLWLMVGFSLGTGTLLGPVRWAARAAQGVGWAQSSENVLVGVMIVAYVGASAWIALWLSREVAHTSLRHVRYGVPLLALVCAGGAVVLWMTPEALAANQGEEVEVGAHFTFGPYPTENKMRRLAAEGYTAIVSLLHPAVVPFEPTLLAKEKKLAAKVGLELIHAPMLPWVSDNDESLDRIEQLAREARGRYYVHCYLGKDRVRLVRRVVEKLEGTATQGVERPARSLVQQPTFERGPVLRLTDGVYLTPYPTDEELALYFLTGELAQVVTLMDPDNPDDRRWIEKERRLFERYDLAFETLPVPPRFEPRDVLEVARKIWTLPRPLVVHHYLAPSSGKSPGSEALVQAFLSNLPPLAPSLFERGLAGGPVEVVAPNVALGPRPEPREFEEALYEWGVRELAYLGQPRSEAARRDAEVAREAGLRWRAVRPVELRGLLAAGGPWYVYGPRLAAARPGIDAPGPAVPGEVRWDADSYVRAMRVGDAQPEVERPISEDPGETPEPAGPAGATLPDANADGVGDGDGDRSWYAAFLRRALPDVTLVFLLGPILILACAAAGSLAGWLRTRKQVRAPFTRKVFHFLVFTLAGALHLAVGLPAVVLFGCIASAFVLYAVARGDGFPLYEAMARPSDSPRRKLFIIVPLITTALGGLIGNLLFAPFAYVGYLVGGWGDAVGEPVGAAWGRHRYRVPSLAGVPATRSLEGSTAVMLTGVLAAFLGLWAYGVPLLTALSVGLVCGLVGAAVEAISNHGLDNLTIQVAASATAFLLLA